MTLRQLIEEAEQSGTIISSDKWGSMTDFLLYFDIHYKPLLEQLEREWAGAEGAKRFFASDILEIFK